MANAVVAAKLVKDRYIVLFPCHVIKSKTETKVLQIHCIHLAATPLPKLDLLSCLQDQESTHLTTGTLRQTLSHPYHLLPIIRLQFSLIFQEKHIHSSTRWQKSDVSSMHNFVEVQSPSR